MIVPAILSAVCRPSSLKPVGCSLTRRGRTAKLVRNILDLSAQPDGRTALIARYMLMFVLAISCYLLGALAAQLIENAPHQAAAVTVAVVAGCARSLLGDQ
jgi:hypothetical protein